jgi:radical SAM superfamily enzyme YgiQ (UPF0313 family)
MIADIIQYSEPLFRPPSESRSFILQPTIGCSWNKCAFCEMYTSKKFKIRSEDDIFKEIQLMQPYSDYVRKVFLADGNAMVLSSGKLINIINKLNATFPKLSRISAYALPKDLKNKSESELKELADAGLKLLYTGVETGDDELLQVINKGESSNSTVSSLIKARNSGIKLSVMILNGLGGKRYTDQHALNSAKVVNEVKPEYLSTLVLSFPHGVNHYKSRFVGDFTELNKLELISEMGNFIGELQLDNTIFRSDHASNYLVLKGVLSRDKSKLLNEISKVSENPGSAKLRPEWLRGL